MEPTQLRYTSFAAFVACMPHFFAVVVLPDLISDIAAALSTLHAELCFHMLGHAVLSHAVLSHAVLSHAVLSHAVSCCAVLSCGLTGCTACTVHPVLPCILFCPASLSCTMLLTTVACAMCRAMLCLLHAELPQGCAHPVSCCAASNVCCAFTVCAWITPLSDYPGMQHRSRRSGQRAGLLQRQPGAKS